MQWSRDKRQPKILCFGEPVTAPVVWSVPAELFFFFCRSGHRWHIPNANPRKLEKQKPGLTLWDQMGSRPGMPASSCLLTRWSEEHQAAEDIRPWLKGKTLRCRAEWFQSALSVLKQTAGRPEEDPKLPPCLGCWAGRGSSLRPAATFIWLKFQGLKSNIPVGKRMAQTLRLWGRGGGWLALRTCGWAVNDRNARQAEEIKMDPAGLPWEGWWPGSDQVKRSSSVSRPGTLCQRGVHAEVASDGRQMCLNTE